MEASLKKYADQIAKTKDDNEKAIQQLEARQTELREELERVQADMTTAISNIDMAALKAANQRKADAELELSMIEPRLQQLRTGSMITMEEYNTIRNAVFTEHSKKEAEYRKKYAPIVKGMLADYKAIFEYDEQADNILQSAHNIMRMSSIDPEIVKLDRTYYGSPKMEDHAIVWFLDNLGNAAREAGIID